MFFSSEIKAADVKFGKPMPEAKGYTVCIMSAEFKSNDYGDSLVVGVDICEGEYTGVFASHPKLMFINLTGQTPWGESNAERAKKTIMTIVKENEGIFAKDEDVFEGDFDENRLIGATVGCVFKWDTNNPVFVKPNYLCTKEYAAKAKVADKPKAKTVSEDFDAPRQEDEAPKKSLFGKK